MLYLSLAQSSHFVYNSFGTSGVDCFVYIRQDATQSYLEVLFYSIGAFNELQECSYRVNAPYQVPNQSKAAYAASLNYFFGFRILSGSFSDPGTRSSKKDRSVSSMCFGISVRRYAKYSYGFKLFAFAISAMLLQIA